MNILHCLAQLPTRTGSGVYFRNLVQEFSAFPEIKQAVLYAESGQQPLDAFPALPRYPLRFDTPELPFPVTGMSDVMPYPTTVYSQMSRDQIEAWHGAFAAKLQEAKASFQPDLIIVHHLWFLARLVLEIFPDRPVYAISHGTDIRQAEKNPELARQYVGSLAGLAGVFALSKLHRPELTELFDLRPEQIRVTGGAYDHEIFYPPERHVEHTPYRFIYAGKLSAAKGCLELVSAFSRLRDQGHDARLKMIGNRSPEFTRFIEEKGRDLRGIVIHDVADQEALAEEFREADSFVFPSYFEGLGLIALEALASGLRLTVNRLPALYEQLGSDIVDLAAIEWVEMPELVHQDEILAEARADYIERLEAAMLRQMTERPSTELSARLIRRYDWPSLAQHIRSHLALSRPV